ncbi:MAG: PEGA domain-containing protein [Chitinivibrionales bacterium]
MYKILCVISCLLVSAYSQESSEPIFISDSSTPSFSHDIKEQQRPSEYTDESPLQSSQAPTGTLKVRATPAEAYIFVNGKHFGNGTVRQVLPPGKYEVFVGYKAKSESRTVYIAQDRVKEVSISLSSKKLFTITSLFSHMWIKGIRAYGPATHLEMANGKNVYGISFNWAFWHDNDSQGSGEAIGGAAFSWHYKLVHYKKILCLSPGFAGGFWYFYRHTYQKITPPPDRAEDNNDYDYYLSRERSLLFGGPFVDFSAGYGRLYLDVRYTLLFGNALGHLLKTGIRVTL